MIYDFNSHPDQISRNIQGGKFYYLYHLNRIEGISVPNAICITDNRFDVSRIESWLDDTQFYAIRSSANLEDKLGQSAAGIFESYLNVSGRKAVLEAIDKCFMAKESLKVKSYLLNNNLSQNTLKLNVIVQEMIPAEKAGVVFTANPLTGKNEILIQWIEGTGENLVSGEINPETIVFDKNDIPKGEIFSALARAAQIIEREFSGAQDIEWAWYKNKLYILQARPVEIKEYPAEEIWTRANIGEIVPKPLTPLSWDIFSEVVFGSYRTKYYSWIDRFFTNLIHLLPRKVPNVQSPKMFSGYLYLNIATILKSFGCEPWVTKEVLQTGLGFEIPYNSKKWEPDFYDRLYTFIKKVIFRIEWLLPSYSMEHRVINFIKKNLKRNYTDSDSSDLEKILQRTKYLFGWHIAVTARSFSHLGYLMEGILKYHKNDFSIFEMVNEISQIQSHSYLQKLESIQSETDLTKKYLLEFGHRSLNEFELAQPSWAEQPHILKSVFKHISKKNRSKIGQDTVLSETFRKLGKRLERSIKIREDIKSELIKQYKTIRMYYLQKAEILQTKSLIESKNDIFYLHKSEIEDLLDGKSNMSPDIAERKIAHKQNVNRSVPFIFYGNESDAKISKNVKIKKNCKGIGCSAGIISAPVIIIKSIDEVNENIAGKIIVTKSADPGWTPFLLQAKGMISEVGGLLSHIATIARENNIPLIVGVEQAIEFLKNGQEVTMDGISGEIILH